MQPPSDAHSDPILETMFVDETLVTNQIKADVDMPESPPESLPEILSKVLPQSLPEDPPKDDDEALSEVSSMHESVKAYRDDDDDDGDGDANEVREHAPGPDQAIGAQRMDEPPIKAVDDDYPGPCLRKA